MCKKYKANDEVQYLYTKKVIYQTKISLLHRGIDDFCF